MNPQRECGWSSFPEHPAVDAADLAQTVHSRAVSYPPNADPEADERTYLTKDDIDWLADQVAGCPACMLAVLRQSSVDDWHYDQNSKRIFDYNEQVKAFRDNERDSSSEW